MEFGDDSVIRCPDCRTLFIRRTILSATSSGMRCWTDGYWYANYMNIAPVIAYCPFCGNWVPLDETEKLFTLPLHWDYGYMPVIEISDECSAADYIAAIGSPRCAGMEKELRIRLWWKQNEIRRNGSGEDLALTQELHDNLERIILLSGPEDTLVRAEAFRELGDFPAALAELSLNDENGRPFGETEPGKTIRIYCGERNILPVLAGERPVPALSGEEVREFHLQSLIGKGFHPFPYPEEIFAFPSEEKETARPFLLVDLGRVNEEWSGWAPFFSGETGHLLKHGRLFTEEEWTMFRGQPAEWKNELKAFWNRPAGDGDDYWRVRFRLYYGYIDFIDPGKIGERQKWFAPFWALLMKQVEETGGETGQWVYDNTSRCYWDRFWRAFEMGYPDLSVEGAEETRTLAREREERYNESRRKGAEGIKYVELGGNPRWFQGNDQTPASVSGRKMDFVGQVWTDYLSAGGSMLVYVFYDHETGWVRQVYDYD